MISWIPAIAIILIILGVTRFLHQSIRAHSEAQRDKINQLHETQIFYLMLLLLMKERNKSRKENE